MNEHGEALRDNQVESRYSAACIKVGLWHNRSTVKSGTTVMESGYIQTLKLNVSALLQDLHKLM